MSICIVGFSFQSFCVWFIPLSATSWGRKSGHLLIYDCPASINLRDLTSPYFVRAQWDYKSMSTAVLIEDWRPLEAGAVSTSGSFLLLFQRGQWARDLHIVSQTSSHDFAYCVKWLTAGKLVQILHSRCGTLIRWQNSLVAVILFWFCILIFSLFLSLDTSLSIHFVRFPITFQ